MPTLLEIVQKTQTLIASKWYLDIRHYADSVGITTEEAYAFIRCIECGGTGNKSDRTWKPNPSPFNAKVNLCSQQDNHLNLHYIDNGRKAEITGDLIEPSTIAVEQSCRFVRLGKMCNQNKELSVNIQRSIAKFVIGTHQMLTRFYPDIAKFRQKNWRVWLEGGVTANQYQQLHLPDIATYFWDVWNAPIARGANPRDLTPTIFDLVKHEIIDLLVRMFIIPTSYLQVISVRRSKRHIDVSDGESDVEIEASQSQSNKRIRNIVDTHLDPNGVDGDFVDNSDPNANAIKLFNLGALKLLWKEHEYEEVGRREIALKNAHTGIDGTLTNLEILEYGGRTYSIAEHQAIAAISKSTIARKLQNFHRLKQWINDTNPTRLFRIEQQQLILEFVSDGRGYQTDRLTNQIFEPSGPRQLKSQCAQIIRHILFTNPKVAISKFPELYTAMFVLINGRAPKECQIPSPSTIRSNIERLNQFDLYDIGQMFVDLSKDNSPCGNKRYFASITDDTKQGTRKKCQGIN